MLYLLADLLGVSHQVKDLLGPATAFGLFLTPASPTQHRAVLFRTLIQHSGPCLQGYLKPYWADIFYVSS